MPSENKIDYIEIPARDPAEAQKFFEKLFGWQFESYGPDYVSFNDGRMVGGFYRSDSVASVATGSVLIVYYRADLRGTINSVTNLGGTMTKDIFPFPGGHRFHFTDPSGNEYAVWSDKGQ